MDQSSPPPPGPERIKQRLERERRARREAETIAEATIRELYDSQQEIRLLHAVATAANESSSLAEAMTVALRELCRATGWPAGRVHVVEPRTRRWIDPPVSYAHTRSMLSQLTDDLVVRDPNGVALRDRIVENGRCASLAGLAGRTAPGEPLPLIDAAYACPIRTGGAVLGVLELLSDGPIEPSEQLRPLLRHVGALLGQVIERARGESVLRQSEEQFRTMFENAQIGIYRTTPDGRIVMANPRLLGLLGFGSFEELAARNLELEGFHSRESRERFKEAMERDGQVSGLDTEWLRSDGRPIHLRENAKLVRDPAGTPLFYEGTVEDVSEKARLEAQLLRVQRVESVGALAGGIAHDLNNVLAPMLMGVDLLRRGISEERLLSIIDTIDRNARRGAALVRQVLKFARGSGSERVPIDVAVMARDLAQMLARTFPRAIEIRTQIGDTPAVVLAAPTEIDQVLVNLCINARDAMPSGGVLSLSVERVDVDAAVARAHVGARAGGYFTVTVEDSGVGIPPEALERIFEPFFTTKPLEQGSGLGLSTVYGIVKSHDGFVSVQSELGRGTRFRVHLPVPETELIATTAETPRPIVPGNGELVLLVDDEAAVRDIGRATLEANGYSAITAEDGAVALAAFVEHRARVAVVVLDMSMPVMDGPATIRALRKLSASVPIVTTSGVEGSGGQRHSAHPEVAASLTKPYSTETLLGTLHDVLHAASARD